MTTPKQKPERPRERRDRKRPRVESAGGGVQAERLAPADPLRRWRGALVTKGGEC